MPSTAGSEPRGPYSREHRLLLGLGEEELGQPCSLCDKTSGNAALTLVRLRARIRRSASCGRPLVGPVAVDVTADARVAADRLAVLAPKAVRSLGVDEAVRVHDGRDVEVELVDYGLDGGVGRVLRQQRVRDVLGGLGRDPLAGMDVPVEDDGGLGAFATAAPDVDAGEGTPADRRAGGVDLRVGWEAGLEVVQEGQVGCIGVVCSEP